MELPNTESPDNLQSLDPGGLVLSSENGSGVVKQAHEVELATMRQMMETLFARIETLQQNQAVQLAGVHDRLDAVELELPLIQEQGALRIRDLESRMGVEIEEAARAAVEELTSGIQEEVTGRFGSLVAQIESQRKELTQMRESKKQTESKLNRAVLDIERLCGSFGVKPVEDGNRPFPERPVVERPAAEVPASPFRSRISEHIRKAALEAVPDDSNPLVGDPGQVRAAAHISQAAGASVSSRIPAGVPPTGKDGPVPGFDDWKRQFMQEGEPLAPSLGGDMERGNRSVVCPRCYSERTRPATRNRIDGFLMLAGFSPHRCRSCAHRFYKRGVPENSAYDEGADSRAEETLEIR